MKLLQSIVVTLIFILSTNILAQENKTYTSFEEALKTPDQVFN